MRIEDTHMRHYPPERVLVFSARKAPDGVSGQIALQHGLQTLFPQAARRDVQSALNDAEEVLLGGSLVCRETSVEPPH